MNGRSRWLPLQLLAAAVAMFGFGYLLVPLYGTYSDVVSIDHGADLKPTELKAVAPDTSRSIELLLVGNALGGGWEIQPRRPELRVHPGQRYRVEVEVVNRTTAAQTLHTEFSAVPTKAVPYLRMGECFCFEEQRFAPGERRVLPVTFQIKRDFPPGVATLTLAFSLYSAAGA